MQEETEKESADLEEETEVKEETEVIVEENLNAEILEAINENTKSIIDFLEEEKERKLELEPTQEEIDVQNQKEEQQEQELTDFRENLLEVLNVTSEKNDKIIELLEVSPDYSASYEEQQIALDNVFSGVNVLIGLVIGVGVAWAFIKGMVK